MNAKQILIGIALANIVGIGALIVVRRSGEDTGQDNRLASANLHSTDALQTPAFELPKRPVVSFATSGHETPSTAAIARLRDMSFEVAEFTNKRLSNHPGALCLLGKLHLRSGELNNAKQIWERALELDDSFVEAHLDLGQLAQKQGDLDGAASWYEKAIALTPNHAEAYQLLVDVLLRQAKLSQAVERLEQRLSFDPKSTKAWCALGRTYQQLDNFEKAAESFERALANDQHSHVAALGLMASYRSLGETEKAQRVAALVEQNAELQFRGATDRNGVDPDLVKMQTLFEFTAQTSARLLAQAGDTQAVISQLQQTTRVLPESRALRKQLVELQLELGNVDDAVRILQDGANANPQDPSGWLDLGIVCLKARRFDAAEAALRKVIELVPDSDTAYALLSQTQMPADRNPSAAVESARRAVEIQPSAGNHYILATAFYNAGDITSTKAELKIAISLAPDHTEYQDALRRIQ